MNNESPHICIEKDVIMDMKTRLEKLEDNDREDYGARKELALSIQMLAESSKEQVKTNSEITATLVKINDNLGILNKEYKEIKIDVNDLKNKVHQEEINSIKDKKNNEIDKFKSHSWDYSSFKQKAINWLVILGAIAILLDKTGIWSKITSFQF